jgi:hypothetical protein
MFPLGLREQERHSNFDVEKLLIIRLIRFVGQLTLGLTLVGGGFGEV